MTATQQKLMLEKARRFLALYEREGPTAQVEHFEEFFHPGYTFRPAIAELGGKEYRGREGVRDWIEDMEEIATDYTLSDVELRLVGDSHLLALGTMHLTGRESGVTFESEYVFSYRYRDGLIVSAVAYLSHADGLRAAEEEEADAEA